MPRGKKTQDAGKAGTQQKSLAGKLIRELEMKGEETEAASSIDEQDTKPRSNTKPKVKSSIIRLADKAEAMAEKLIRQIEQSTNPDDVTSVEDLLKESASKLDSTKSYLTKDITEASVYLLQKLSQIVSETSSVVDNLSLTKNQYARQIIKLAKEMRERKKTQPMELNLMASNPFFTGIPNSYKEKVKETGLAEVVKNGTKTLEYQNSEGLYLSEFDKRVFTALTSIWVDQNCKQIFKFTEFELLRRLEMNPKGGMQHKRVRDSLRALTTTQIVIKEFYEKKNANRIVTSKFHLVASETTIEEYSKDDGKLQSREYQFQFADQIRQSFQDGYTTLISLGILDTLNTKTSRELYQLLCTIRDMAPQEQFKYTVEAGAFDVSLTEISEYMHLANNEYDNRRNILKACEELKEVYVLQDYVKLGTGRSCSAIRFYPGTLLKKEEVKVLTQG
ncbi:hypothetical protein PM3016_2791 [Paenibacillus mucilaginosus 3016]|uniref:Uncharacterized protein n=4 Tax=Paenibacillus mucilaginosus TaxID=61624 RepID=H6NJI7_9BACL|nr:hypothetical protein KNP414_02535 [Paenibacillus mucilaginosus KNP414]AFC29667.1 hypothetical protein PM3016_2791 [Paenibacillus mucilaginosus 3016]AFH61846.1 hypothetical protein B2K_14160 [Paenibacillus mucilaginosus K02]WDM30158.1 replication initiation protein [Paenibacillus mucilaginosus]WFA18345.1 RepB family plasmid replication initiator protein [Paenibacillus mucilaginosus]